MYVPIVTLSNQQLKSCFKKTIYSNKHHQSKPPIARENEYLDYLIDPSFQKVNRLFVLSFKYNAHWTRHAGYFLTTVEIKDYNVMIHGTNFPINQWKFINSLR